VIINTIGLVLIAFIVWWFWLAKAKPRTAGQDTAIEIVADNGVYSPAVIEVKKGQPVTLRFIRKDANPCAEKVIFSDINVSADLELNQPKELTLTLDNGGEHEFTCQMGMYRGKILVRQ
jgi:plastocyanin domain-containing protein